MKRDRTMKKNLARPGDHVGAYQIERFLGRGCEGDVFVASHRQTGSIRSLKLFRGRNMMAEVDMTADYFRRLANVATVKRLRGGGVVEGQPSIGARHFLVFDFIEGYRLDRRLHAISPNRLALKLCEALLPVHRKGLAIGDFDYGRNVIVTAQMQRLVFCDLDIRALELDDTPSRTDLGEVRDLVLKAYRLQGRVPDRRIVAALNESTTVREAAEWLRSIVLK